ncbi:MAG TPA: DNA mismatch repair protein MutS, partial [Thermomicrobiales bacterium]|nr:DNA mismatch repair protein MutS [Thermomicrobiales bacterium]
MSTRPEPDSAVVVPSRRQYLDLKSLHPDAILLYRLGDFYETFDDDAHVLARDARVTLTSRSFGRSGRAPMAGIPHHALNHYLQRLLAAGHTVAIADQVGPVGKGLVRREITRVVSPGTVAEPALLPAGESRYLAALMTHGERIGLAWVDVSAGEFAAIECAGADREVRLREELARIGPAECLFPDDWDDAALPPAAGRPTRLERRLFDPERAASALRERFGVRSLAGYGIEAAPAATGAAGAILAYLERTNPALVPLLTTLRTEWPGRGVGLDAATRRNLELTRSFGTGGSRGSLLGMLDRTRTAMGARALRRLVGQPLRDLPELGRRQAIVGALAAHGSARAALGQRLAAIGDLERLTGRIVGRGATIRDYASLRAALAGIPSVRDELTRLGPAPAPADIDPCADLLAVLTSAIEEDDGRAVVIRQGFAPDLDAAIAAAHDTRQWLGRLEARERERTGIRSLKVGFNKVFGYYIEVTRPNLSLVPAEYSRKQTVAVGERFVTASLKDAEARLLAADDEIAALEAAALERLAAAVTAAAPTLLTTARTLADLDALLALADVAVLGDWVAPTLTESDDLAIEAGRHPVVETSLGGETFIPNDCRLGGDGCPRQLIVTGPNMGGKSTYLRQAALIVVLAQIGSFVPARAARIGLVDRIFSRVGAHDDLARGQSTFMVEMVETAAILHQATRRSLLILDEVGRGTGMDDGLAIARATLEDISTRIGARCLF